MTLLKSLAVLLVTFFVAVATTRAQAWGGSANFPDLGMTITLTLNNADTTDESIGTIDTVQVGSGNPVVANTPIWWKRINGDVVIYGDEAKTVVLGKLKGLPKNQPVATPPTPSGEAEMNDDPPNDPTKGDYWRNS